MAVADSTPLRIEDVSDTDYSNRFMDRLTKFLETQKYTDVTLKTGDVEIQCHRVILAAASDYFDTMFSSGFKERTADVVEIPKTDSETLTSLVKYVYSSNVRITTNNVWSLVQASHQFRLMGLLMHCEKFIARDVTPSNAVRFNRFAELYDLKSLKDAARPCMLNNFEEIVQSTEFSNMAVEEIVEYISDDKLKVVTEDKVFDAVCAWIRFDPKNREPLFTRILEHVRLPLCTLTYLAQSVASFPLIIQKESHKYLQEALVYKAGPERCTEHSSPRTKTRAASTKSSSVSNDVQCLVYLGVVNENNKNCLDVNYYKAGGSSWERLTQLPENVRHFSAVVVQSGIFITGGRMGESSSIRSCWLFNRAHKHWNAMPSMINARHLHGSVVHNGYVYVIGGLDSSGRCMDSMERYDQMNKQWSLMKNMPNALYDLCAVTNDQYIYMFLSNNPHMYVYDAVCDTWEQAREIPANARCRAAVVVNDKIYVHHYHPTPGLMSYDIQLDLWTVLARPTGFHSAAAYWQGKLVFYGYSGYSTSSQTEEYDLDTDSWSDSVVLPDCAHRAITLLCPAEDVP